MCVAGKSPSLSLPLTWSCGVFMQISQPKAPCLAATDKCECATSLDITGQVDRLESQPHLISLAFKWSVSKLPPPPPLSSSDPLPRGISVCHMNIYACHQLEAGRCADCHWPLPPPCVPERVPPTGPQHSAKIVLSQTSNGHINLEPLNTQGDVQVFQTIIRETKS